MKIKEGFLLRSIAQEIVVVPVSGDLDLNMIPKYPWALPGHL